MGAQLQKDGPRKKLVSPYENSMTPASQKIDAKKQCDPAITFLQYSDGAWLRILSAGLIFIALGIGGHVAGAVLRWINDPAKGVAHDVAAVLLMMGVFLVTRREPAQTRDSNGVTLTARILVGLELVLWLVMGMKSFKWIEITHLKPLILLVLAIQGALAVLMGIYLSDLARRIPDDDLVSRLFLCGWLIAIACAALMVVRLMDLATWLYLMFFMFSFPLIAGIVAVLGWTASNLLKMRTDLLATVTAIPKIKPLRAREDDAGFP